MANKQLTLNRLRLTAPYKTECTILTQLQSVPVKTGTGVQLTGLIGHNYGLHPLHVSAPSVPGGEEADGVTVISWKSLALEKK
jgi:hypothetical protein